MTKPVAEDRRLIRISRICARLPRTERDYNGRHAAFRVAKKTYAWFLHDHHGDGIVSLCVKVLPGDNARLAAASPERFYPPAYLASRGWVALRLDRGAIDWDEVTELLKGSYKLIAPKSLGGGV